jgi:hypothetical protein
MVDAKDDIVGWNFPNQNLTFAINNSFYCRFESCPDYKE